MKDEIWRSSKFKTQSSKEAEVRRNCLSGRVFKLSEERSSGVHHPY